MSDVFISMLRVYTQFIHEDFKKYPKTLLESMTNQPLKCCRSISQAEWHDSISKDAPFGSRGSLVLIAFGDGNLIVA